MLGSVYGSKLKNNAVNYMRAFSTAARKNAITRVETLPGSLNTISIDDFRKRAFNSEQPILITTHTSDNLARDASQTPPQLPAIDRWFESTGQRHSLVQEINLNYSYLEAFKDTIVPYELLIDPKNDNVFRWVEAHGKGDGNEEVVTVLKHLLETSTGETFHRFDAPLSFFLQAAKAKSPALQMLYIAQCQIADLPRALQDDLPTPRVVKEAGKGDVYDANIWLGLPPTYTPLHKDPNPNLFVQLVGTKQVRLYPPTVGRAIFFGVQQRIGQQASATFRGFEMMEGLERHALGEAVWGESAHAPGYEAIVESKDALFIPKGWWHSIRSVGDGISGSVNWWFR